MYIVPLLMMIYHCIAMDPMISHDKWITGCHGPSVPRSTMMPPIGTLKLPTPGSLKNNGKRPAILEILQKFPVNHG